MEFKIIEWIISGILSIILINLGIAEIINPNKYTGIIVILISFTLIYISFYAFQIRNNKKEILELKREIKDIEENNHLQQKLLNTIKDIVILNKLNENENEK